MAKISTSYSVLQDHDRIILVRAEKTLRSTTVSILAQCDSVEDAEYKAAWASAQLDMARGKAIWAHPLSTAKALYRSVPTPLTVERKARDIVPSLLDVQLPFSLEDASIGIESWSKTPSGTLEASVSIVRNAVLEEEIDSLEQTFAQSPHIISHEMLALKDLGSIDSSFKAEPRHLIVLFRSTHISALLLHEGAPKQLWVRRNTGDTAENLGVLADRIRRNLNLSEDTSLGLTYVGMGIPTTTVRQEFQHRLGGTLTVQNARNPESLVPACLAYTCLQRNPVMNLREESFPHPEVQRRQHQTRKSQRSALILMSVVFMASCFLWMSILKKAETQRRVAMGQLAQSLAPNRRIQPGMEVVTVERQLDSSQTQRARIKWMSQGGALALLNSVFREYPDSMRVRRVFLGHAEFGLSGTSRDEDGLREIEARLQNIGWVTSREQTPVAEGLSFEIRGQK